MSALDAAHRTRGFPNGPASDRNGSTQQRSMSRAERFEDEKRRISDNCFSKKDADGTALEQYITHIRILEDAAYPSVPPPPQSSPDNKKPRAIIIAVRKTGRVRVHKARENTNGTFSIGKTWNLDDLTVIESFSGASPANPEEQQRKQWAGEVGFLITIQKPYYWQANTAKEKDFFVASLVKIFKKYTGRLPQLHGFDSHELEQLALGPAQQPKPLQGRLSKEETSSDSQRQSPHREPTALKPIVTQGPEHSRSTSHETQSRQSQETARSRRSQDHIQPQSYQDQSQSQPPPNHPQLRPSQEQISAKAQNEVNSPRLPGQYPSSEFIRRMNPQGSPGQLKAQRSDSTSNSVIRNNVSGLPRNPSPRRADQSHSTDSFASAQDPYSGQQQSSSHTNVERIRANGGTRSRQESPSHRRSTSSVRAEPDELFVTPSGTPEPVRDHSPPPSLSREPSEIGDAISEVSKRSQAIPSTSKASVESTVPMPVSEPPPESSNEAQPEEVYRPGLGPMIKKKSNKEIASMFRKAAVAHTAFKPRPGGAADKLRAAKESANNEPDGVTGVVPAPSILRGYSQENSKVSAADVVLTSNTLAPRSMSDDSDRVVPFRSQTPEAKQAIPQLQITTPLQSNDEPASKSNPQSPRQRTQSPEEPSKSPVSAQDDRRRKQQSDHSAEYAKALDISPSLIQSRTFEIEAILNDFEWSEGDAGKKTFEKIDSDIRKELARVEAGSWLGGFENNDERVGLVANLLDKAIAECDELDGLLTLYNVELGTLDEDIAYIEAQSQGLQVQTANQKLLQAEMLSLLDTISIPAPQLQMLKDASLNKSRGIQVAETALGSLYKAMLTIDPEIKQQAFQPTASDGSSDRATIGGYAANEISSMRAVREKRDAYRQASVSFLHKFGKHLSEKFPEAEAHIERTLERGRNGGLANHSTKLDGSLREEQRQYLWQYSPLMLVTREVESSQWDDLMRIYESTMKKSYSQEFKDNVFAWQRIASHSTVEEQDYLFTSQEKESDSLVGRKLTVKRNKTLRTDGGGRNPSGAKSRDGKINAYEALAGAVHEMSSVVSMEQNFIVDFFHLSSMEVGDYLDIIAASPEARKLKDLTRMKPFDPDRTMARRAINIMEEIFSFWPTDLQDLVDWVVKADALQSVGILIALESKLSEYGETDQEYITQVLTKIHDRTTNLFTRFVDEQIRGIEDTKVKIKKRKGVIAFMKTFPSFSNAIENSLPHSNALNQPEARLLVDDAYQKINKAMFDCLNFIAKESPSAGTAVAGQTGGDPEDKEILNYHILLIENMNHYIEEVDVRGILVLEEWKERALTNMREHMELYLTAVIRRPLGRLLDFLESTEALLPSTPIHQSIANRPSHSRSTAKKVLASYDTREIRRGIETLKKRVEKHFGDADDPGLSRGLVQKVLKECENRYISVEERANRLAKDVYEGSLEVEWRRDDVSAAFRR